MKTIYKYPLAPGDTAVELPAGAEVLSAREQGDVICVWAVVDTAVTKTSTRTFHSIRTGQPLPNEPKARYLGTALLPGGIAYHVYEAG